MESFVLRRFFYTWLKCWRSHLGVALQIATIICCFFNSFMLRNWSGLRVTWSGDYPGKTKWDSQEYTLNGTPVYDRAFYTHAQFRVAKPHKSNFFEKVGGTQCSRRKTTGTWGEHADLDKDSSPSLSLNPWPALPSCCLFILLFISLRSI